MWLFKKKKSTEAIDLDRFYGDKFKNNELFIEYRDNFNKEDWNLEVFVNGENVGALERGRTHGFWFVNKIGESIFGRDIKSLKLKVDEEFKSYMKFFERFG